MTARSGGHGPKGRHLLLAAAAVTAVAAPAHTAPYVETFQAAPGGTGYAALLGSPNGVTYDMYDARAFARMAGQNITVIGTGDEGFYWGTNGLLPPPRYGLPGTTYSSDTTDYLLNGYGTGYHDWVLGINFTAGPTVVDSLDFGLANGSNAPAPDVTVRGLRNGAEVWSRSTGVAGNVTLAGGAAAVDRIEIDRAQNTTPLFGGFTLGWYTLDNLTYETDGPASGGYSWKYYTRYDYLGALGGGAPEPATWALLVTGFGLVGSALRGRRRARAMP